MGANIGFRQAQAGIAASREKSARIEQKLNSLRTKLAVLQQDQSQRERSLADITDGLTRRLLPDGAFGTFDPRDEDRPFRLSMRGGEAYRVLEVLLGDVACMLDSARSESALPGLFIHDCPREADMSAGLYENFLSLIGELQNLYANHALPFQPKNGSWTRPNGPSWGCAGKARQRGGLLPARRSNAPSAPQDGSVGV